MSHVGSLIAIDGRVLDDDFRSDTHIILSKVGACLQDTLDDVFSDLLPVQAEVDIAWFGHCDLLHGGNSHITENTCYCFGNLYWWTPELIFSSPWHNRYGVIAKAGLCREAQIYG